MSADLPGCGHSEHAIRFGVGRVGRTIGQRPDEWTPCSDRLLDAFEALARDESDRIRVKERTAHFDESAPRDS